MAENLFLFIAALVIASAFWVVFSPKLIHSAVSLLFTRIGTAGRQMFLYGGFIAGTKIVIYGGCILVLIIFGVMLTSKIDSPSIASSSANQFIGGMGAFAIFVMSALFNCESVYAVFQSALLAATLVRSASLRAHLALVLQTVVQADPH